MIAKEVLTDYRYLHNRYKIQKSIKPCYKKIYQHDVIHVQLFVSLLNKIKFSINIDMPGNNISIFLNRKSRM